MESSSEAARTTPADPTADPGAQVAVSIASSIGRMTEFVDRFASVASAQACVGPAQTANGHTVIPVASVSLQAGFGLGFGGGSSGEEGRQGQGSGGGSGGGGRGGSRVIAVVDVSEAGVSVRPVPDVTNLALGLFALLGLRLITGRAGSGAASRRLMGQLKSD